MTNSIYHLPLAFVQLYVFWMLNFFFHLMIHSLLHQIQFNWTSHEHEHANYLLHSFHSFQCNVMLFSVSWLYQMILNWISIQFKPSKLLYRLMHHKKTHLIQYFSNQNEFIYIHKGYWCNCVIRWDGILPFLF